MLVQTPPMGWNSWNTYGENISEDLILTTAEAMREQGLLEAGYRYVVIDDCYALRERDEQNRIAVDPAKFPHGMKWLSDRLHEMGFLFGMYSCCGTRTCARYPSSFEHEFTDAKTFAAWGVDYLKYDYCNKPRVDGDLLYKKMGLALANCGRDIVFSACSWGADDTKSWIKSTGANLWRSTGDIFDSWESIKILAEQQNDLQPYNAMNCFNDMDMLVVGMHGGGNVGRGGCTDEEYRTHFSLWAMLNSPLMIGCDVRKMDAATKEILLNREVIALNQDPDGRQPYRFDAGMGGADVAAWAKPLSGGDVAVGVFNFCDDRVNPCLHWWDLGLSASSGYGFAVRDLWQHRDLGLAREDFQFEIPAHGCRMFRLRLADYGVYAG